MLKLVVQGNLNCLGKDFVLRTRDRDRAVHIPVLAGAFILIDEANNTPPYMLGQDLIIKALKRSVGR